MALSVSNLSPSAIHTLPASSIRPTGAMPPWGFLGLSKRFVEKIGDNSCYKDIVANYPGMDSASQTIVKILCENELNTLDPGSGSLSDQGIHGIRDALQKNTNLLSFSKDIACLDSSDDCPDCSVSFWVGAAIGGVVGTVLTASVFGICIALQRPRSGASQPLLRVNDIQA